MRAGRKVNDRTNSREPKEDVMLIGGLWACPACREMNSDEQRECIACGQRVIHVKVPSGEETNAMGFECGLEESSFCDAASRRAVDPEAIRELTNGVDDWTCPVCGETVHGCARPKSRLQLTAKLLLAFNLLVTGTCMILVISFANQLDAVLGRVLGGKVRDMLVLLPSIALSGWALSLPRVVVLRCTRCGSLHRQYRTPPGFFRAIPKS
jgi:hypothetical protein